jgi:hypothetical protein
MKNTLKILLFILPFIGCSQTNYNELTNTDYYNITFNNVTISQLSEFQGNNNDLNQLLNVSFENTSNDPEDEAKTFESDDIRISYFGYPPNMELSGISVLNINIPVVINGVTIMLADNVSLLGYGNQNFNSFVSSNYPNKSYAIFKPEFEDSYVSVTFITITGIITEIEYVSPL